MKQNATQPFRAAVRFWFVSALCALASVMGLGCDKPTGKSPRTSNLPAQTPSLQTPAATTQAGDATQASGPGLQEDLWGRFPAGIQTVFGSPDGGHAGLVYAAGQKVRVSIDGKTIGEYDGVSSENLLFNSDGSHFAFTARKGKNSYVVRDGKEGPGYQLLLDAALSPNGQRLAYWARNTNGLRFVVDGKESDPLDGMYRTRPVFSPDSLHLACVVGSNGNQRVLWDGQEGPAFKDIRAESLHFSPDGKHLAYTTSDGLIVDGQTASRSSIRQTFTVFSPDSRRVAHAMFNRVYIDGREGPAFDRILDGPPVFSPDGQHVVYGARRGTDWYAVVDDQLSSPWEALLPQTFTYSPDGRHLAYVAKKDGRWILVFDAEERLLSPATAQAPLLFSPDSQHLAMVLERSDKQYVVLGDHEDPAFDSILPGTMGFSPDSQHLAYIAATGQSLCVVLDGKADAPCTGLVPGGPHFQADGTLQYVGIRNGNIYRIRHRLTP